MILQFAFSQKTSYTTAQEQPTNNAVYCRIGLLSQEPYVSGLVHIIDNKWEGCASHGCLFKTYFSDPVSVIQVLGAQEYFIPEKSICWFDLGYSSTLHAQYRSFSSTKNEVEVANSSRLFVLNFPNLLN